MERPGGIVVSRSPGGKSEFGTASGRPDVYNLHLPVPIVSSNDDVWDRVGGFKGIASR